MPDRITFTTEDGVTIVGAWNEAPANAGAILLLHMMPTTRESWGAMQKTLADKGLSSLAIDLRGHGESTQGPEGTTLNYREFTDEQHQGSSLDVEAAIAWLRDKKIEYGRMGLMGSSIGATLALVALADEPRIPSAVLLSPGDYRGLRLVEASQDLNPDQSLCILASADDSQAYAASKQLSTDAPVDHKEFIEYAASGHGNAMLDKVTELPGLLADWLLATLR